MSKLTYFMCFYRDDCFDSSGKLVSSNVSVLDVQAGNLLSARERFIDFENDFYDTYRSFKGYSHRFHLLLTVPTSFVYASIITDTRRIDDVVEDVGIVRKGWLYELLQAEFCTKES